MSLVIEVVSSPRGISVDAQLTVGADESAIIGRGVDASLCLPCPDRAVSRKHAEILGVGDVYYLVDHSANGVYVNNASTPIGAGNRHRLASGDTLALGAFTLKVSELSGCLAEGQLQDSPLGLQDDGQAANDLVEAVAPASALATEPVGPEPPAVLNFAHPLLPEVEELAFELDPMALSGSDHAKVKNDFGDLEDNFSPPSFSIPEDWDTDCSHTPAEPLTTAEEASTGASVVPFASKSTRLLEALLEGLGQADCSVDDLTVETMRKLGRCFDAAINAQLSTRDEVQSAKSKLSFDKISRERQKESDPLGGLKSASDFWSAILDTTSGTSQQLDEKLVKSAEYILEDMADIANSHQLMLDKLHKSLCPDAISQALVQSHNKESAHSDLAPSKLNDGFSGAARKWAFFQRNWQRIFAHANVAIKKDNETRFLLSHARRMGARDEAK
ncbi:FHA domain-containing protein [Halioxenophilus aromaticivorans]|uniref:FHA domain-containing protein n=1 Tax=Halioxenophilus aromaticivorans TaxID=1306992 RepID=A0AAV3U300_9ALTE